MPALDGDSPAGRVRNCFARAWGLLCFSWLTPVLVAGQAKQLSLDALPERSPSDDARRWADSYNDALDRYDGRCSPVLLAYLRVFWPYLVFFQLVLFVEGYAALLLPFLTQDLLELAQAQADGVATGEQISRGCRAAAWTASYQVLIAFVDVHGAFLKTRVGLRFGAATTGAVMRRAILLRDDPGSSIYNIINYDLPACVSAVDIALGMVRLPLQVSAAVYILYAEIKLAFVPAFAVAVCLRVLDAVLNGLDGCLRDRLLHWKDARMEACEEAIANVRGIQMYGWEDLFAARINELRDRELRIQAWKLFAAKTSAGLNYVYPFVVTFAALVTYALHYDAEIDATTVVPVMAWLAVALAPLAQMPVWLNELLVFRSAHRRVMRFLCAPRVEPPQLLRDLPRSPVAADNHGPRFHQEQQHESMLQPLVRAIATGPSMRPLPAGGLTVVVGPTGSGKSFLLAELLEHSFAFADSITAAHQVSFTPQAPVVFTGSVQSNILCGSSASKAEANAVLDACGLTEDVERMPSRENTGIAAAGMSLSGGQRRRISLARAVFHARRRKCAVLLDDPFASIDANTSGAIARALLGSSGLLKDLPVTVASQDASFLAELPPDTDVRFLSLEGCRVVGDRTCTTGELDWTTRHKPPPRQDAAAEAARVSGDRRVVREDADAHPIVEEEGRVSGNVRLAVYRRYGAAAGWCALVAIVVSCVCINSTQQAVQIWVAYWTSQDQAKAAHTLFGFSVTAHTNSAFVSVYSRLLALFIIANFSGFWVEVLSGVRASRRIFRDAVHGVLRQPVRWWDRAGAGLVENRLTVDVNIMDGAITTSVGVLTGAIVFLLGHVLVLALMTPWLLSIVVVVPVLYERLLVRYYRSQNRELQRLVLSTRSPVFASAQEALQHRVVLRCHGASWAYDTAIERLSASQKASYSYAALGAWLTLRFAIIGQGVITLSTLNPIFQVCGIINKQSAAWVALGMGYTQGLVMIVQQLATDVVAMEQALVSIERLEVLGNACEFCATPSNFEEAAALVPQCGSVEFEHVTLRYMPHPWPAALDDVSFWVPSGARVAVMGRTGSGKSTLVVALLRLVLASTGRIRIGTMPVDAIDLKALRQEVVAVIPQVPVTFSGNALANVDPAAVRPQASRNALREVGMSPEQEVASAGQQARVAVARVLAQPERMVVVADEATASLSPAEAADVAAALRSLKATLLVVTHQPEVGILMRCTETLHVAAGRLTQANGVSLPAC